MSGVALSLEIHAVTAKVGLLTFAEKRLVSAMSGPNHLAALKLRLGQAAKLLQNRMHTVEWSLVGAVTANLIREIHAVEPNVLANSPRLLVHSNSCKSTRIHTVPVAN